MVAVWSCLCAPGALAAEKAKDCVVCTKIVTAAEKEFGLKKKQAKEAGEKLDALAAIESTIDDICNNAKSAVDKKVCYYLVPIKRKISQPMSNYIPADRICKKLKAESPEICNVREAVKVEKGQTDYTKLRVKELKKILMDRGVTCTNCLEKDEFVKRCQETEDLHEEL
ncbi:Mesencephalic astrocyte-derived neurotrophic factor homolog (MANF/CDNF-like protein) [Durusdinium trenchii]|uniref:Mesencephalic astrocyte-derived neurotrophic factor homolog n=1 Tax=Durusdinium trenchii TaxID=1381693 RepID=A0ABP0SQS4_9DINO